MPLVTVGGEAEDLLVALVYFFLYLLGILLLPLLLGIELVKSILYLLSLLGSLDLLVLSKRHCSDYPHVKAVRQDLLPVARLGIHHHFVHDALAVHEVCKPHLYRERLLTEVARKAHLELDYFRPRLHLNHH